MENFNGKVVVITGGSSGIGRSTALAFAKQGAKVVIVARGIDRGNEVLNEIKKEGGEGIFVKTDVTKVDEVKHLMNTIVEKYGRIDCAFNNAAVYEYGCMSFTADFSEEDFDNCISMNLKGIWLCMKYEIQQMLKQNPNGGSIVNTSSIVGLKSVPGVSIYSAAKAGIISLTQSASQEYGKKNIRVNALVPGVFNTPMLNQVIDRRSKSDPEMKESIVSDYQQQIALGRIGKPEEAADAVLWLCSGASSYVTGHSLVIDGYRTIPFRLTGIK